MSAGLVTGDFDAGLVTGDMSYDSSADASDLGALMSGMTVDNLGDAEVLIGEKQ